MDAKLLATAIRMANRHNCIVQMGDVTITPKDVALGVTKRNGCPAGYTPPTQTEPTETKAAARMRKMREKRASQSVTERNQAEESVTAGEITPPLSLPPPSPHTPLPPPTHTPPQEEKSPARTGAKSRTADELAAANALGLDDMLAGSELIQAWQAWKEWRTERATKPLVGEKAAPWALRGATLARNQLRALAATTGTSHAAASVNFSIANRYLSIVAVRTPSTNSRFNGNGRPTAESVRAANPWAKPTPPPL